MSLITSGIQSFFSAPWIIIPLILIFGISAFWMPYHHVALEVVQAVHTDIIRPLATQVLLPVAETLAPAYEKFVAWWNFGNMIIRKFVLEMALIPLRCEYTPTFLRTMLRSILPLCRTGILLLKMTGDTIVGRSTDQEVPKLVVGLSFGAFANMTDAVAGLSGCYCGIIPYYLDFAVMFLNTDSVRCTASNSLAIYQEWIALYVRFYLRLFSYLLDALKWFICRVFGSIFQTGTSECTVEDFPLPNIPRLIPDIDILVDEIEAFVCCLADAVDDIANAAIDTGVDIANTIQLFPGRTLESIDYWKFTTVMKASAPSILEFIRTYYTVGTEVVTLSFNFSKVDKEKSRAAATFMCDELTRGAMSFQLPYTEWQGLQHVMAASYAPYVIPTFIGPGQEATFIYGPRFLNHSCLALVSLQRAVFGMLVNVRSYEDYKTGHYFDCFLREVRDAAVVAAEDSAELFSLLPAWRSCTVVPTVHDEDGMPKLLGFPTVRCPESAFHEELGQIMAAPIAITSATLDYLASVSEHLDDIDAARRVSSGCIFDALDDAVDSSTKTLAVALDQLPNTVADTKLMINITGNFTEELMLWIIPRIGTLTGKFTPDHSLSLQDALNAVEGTQEFIDFIVEKLDKIPFQERTVVDPILGVRPFGIYDFLPVIFSVRTIPPLMRDVGKMLVEMVRFLADTIHTANFNASYANTFDPDNFERLVTAQSALAHSLSESVFGPICSIKQVLHDEYDAGTTPSNCKWRIRWDAADFTVCPIELIPCPEEALAHMGLALARIADLPFKVRFFKKTNQSFLCFTDKRLDSSVSQSRAEGAARSGDLRARDRDGGIRRRARRLGLYGERHSILAH